ncbi:histamine N-methyltransferase B-like [Clytia hemisphaerica]|uniref:Uncharacterized protein n=1 Tax=Clytia hemisphaerica TaxID=252671 RepID=A0A7M5X4D2_9CNID|eukprot:TCONS_00003945-protein
MLSIGAGTGCIETGFINDLGLKLSFYYAIEPTAGHRLELKKSIQTWGNIPHVVDSCFFTPEFETEHRFDFVMMSHSLYCMKEWKNILGRIHTLLAPGGKFILFIQAANVQSMEIMYQYATINPPPIQDHTISAKTVSKELEKRGITFSISTGPSKLEITDFYEGKEEGKATHVIDFLLQTKYVKTSAEIRHAVRNYVMDRSDKSEDGKWWFRHPNAMFLIEK